MLRTFSLWLHSSITGSYVSGSYSIVFVNCPNEQIARDIARAILDKKMASSVNILPKTSSLYFWKGEIEEGTEVSLLIKTKTSKVSRLFAYMRQAPEPGLSARAPWESQGLFGLEAQERGFWRVRRNSEDFLSRKEYGGVGEGQGDVAMCLDDDDKSSEHERVQSWSLARCFGHPVSASPHPASQKQLVHPFEIPEAFSIPMDQGDARYLQWLEEGMKEN
ncbi:CutA divalent cation tolerance homolog-like [Apodemus speciosus]|uniref:CutA divalent cation tolerance homolog-like n=1 Tax=Apodemus speciosus TaxID=105296 RepID=A0ABQ0EHE4_APOSI